jgi:gamma-glutamylcyclotransferase (GGCT)/AIG2-like uncharacterized protein YtfP
VSATVELFVYGTLVPGGRWWDEVERFVRAHRPAHVPGRLYDTGRGYPAATFAAGGGPVVGVVLVLGDPDAALAHLDEFEGEEYERVTVRTSAGDEVLTYAWRAPLAGLALVPGADWAAHWRGGGVVSSDRRRARRSDFDG